MSLKLGSNDTAILAGSSVVKQILLGSSPKFAAPVLDHVPGAAAAYSLRRLSNAYSGPVVKVRRSSDSTTADFTAAEVVDGTLEAWVGAGDGFVDTWYDQSGNERNATQATAGYQPKLVSSGALVTEGGKAALRFDGVDDKIDVVGYKPSGTVAAFGMFTYASLAINNASVFSCHKAGSPSGGFTFFNYTPGPTKIAFQTGLGGTWVDGVNELDLGDFDLNPTLVAIQIRSAGTTMYIRGASVLDSAVGVIAAGSDLRIGGNAVSPSSNPFNGTWQELIIYPSDVSASRELAEGEIAWHYGLQAKLPYDHAYAPQALGGGSQTVPTDSDAIAYLEAVAAADGAAVERSVAIAIDDFVKGLKDDGLWSAIGSACVLAGARTVSGALVPLKGAAPTGYNWVASDYSRSLGLQGDGSTKYIDSNRENNADGQNDQHLAVFASQGTSRALIGAGLADTGTASIFASSATSLLLRCRSSDYDNFSGGGTGVGMIAMSRSSAGSYSVFATGNAGTFERASESPYSGNIYVFGRSGGTLSAASGRLSFYSIGASLDLAALDAKVTALMSQIAAALA